MITYYLSFLPFLLFFTLIPVLYLIIYFIIKQKPLSLIIALAISPLIHSQLLYFLFMYFPNNSDLFYLLSIFSVDFILFLLFFQNFINKFPIIKFSFKKLSTLENFLILTNVSILLFVLIRAIFYNVTWDDQKIYLKQTYVFNQTKSLDIFITSGVYSENNFKYQMNSGIRPGLPFIYGYILLISKDYQVQSIFSQSIIFYYYLITLILICYSSALINKNKHVIYPLFTVFLVQTSFNFINYSIWGFKELLIISLILVSFILIKIINSKQNSIKTLILFGVILGLISFINFSGSIIGLILLLIQFLFSNKTLYLRPIYSLIILTAFIIFSFFELSFFLGWLLSSYSIPGSFISFNTSAYTKMQEISGGGELQSYKIYNDSDILIKGKLQGFTQIEMYGVIFILFLFTSINFFKNIFKNRQNLIIFSFIILFYLIIIDLIGLNNNYYSSVTVVSSKYTVMLVPLIAIIISSQLDKLMLLTNKVKPIHLLIAFLLYITFYFSYIYWNISTIFNLIKNIIPIWNSDTYYINRLSFYFKLSIAVTILSTLVILVLFKIKGIKKLNSYWLSKNFSTIIISSGLFLLPLLLSILSNFQLIAFH